MPAGKAEFFEVLAQTDGMASLARQSPNFGRREFGIPERNMSQRNEPSRVGPAPLVDVPVVVSLQHHQGETFVFVGTVKDMSLTAETPFLAKCVKLGLEFNMEVAATDATQSHFVLRLQLLRGEAALFREMCARIIPRVK